MSIENKEIKDNFIKSAAESIRSFETPDEFAERIANKHIDDLLPEDCPEKVLRQFDTPDEVIKREFNL